MDFDTIWFYTRQVWYVLFGIIKRIFRFIWTTGFYFGVTFGIIGFVLLYIKVYPMYVEYDKFATEAVENCNRQTFRLEEPSYIFDDNDKVLVKLKGSQDSTYLNYKNIPENIINAFVAVEDRSFWENPGIDIKGLMRVGVDAVRTKGKEMHGASTITQQLARNIFLTHEVSLERKGKEMLIAYKLTKKFSKEDIMEFYVNDICFANALYGIESASKAYFNKSVKDLSLSQQVYLCAIPNSPSYYDPYKNPERAVVRRNKMLKDMYGLGYITYDEYNEAVNEEIVIERPTKEFNDYLSTYAIDCAVRFLMERDGFRFKYEFDTNEEYKEYNEYFDIAYEQTKTKLYTQGYKVYTTLNKEKQQILQDAIDKRLEFSEEKSENGIYAFQGAGTLIDNGTGKVVAIVGGRSQEQTTYSLNRAYQSFRQPGSSIKPLIVYTPALDKGYTENSLLKNIDVSQAKEKGVVVSELEGADIPLRTAVTKSLNGCAWWLFDKVTARRGIKYITDMQFENIVPSDYYPASSLGGFTNGVTTVEMASAYSTLVNNGTFRNPTCIRSVKDSNGQEIYYDKPKKQIYEQSSANEIIDIMKDVVSKGTAASMGWSKVSKIEAAGKTGTTNGGKDGWFCGVTPYYSLAIWVGYDMPRELKSLYGGTYPAEIWKNTMSGVLEITDTSDDKEFNKEFIGTGKNEVAGAKPWDSYLPGRLDEELLSEGYTVGDYRQDHIYSDEALIYIQEIIDKKDTASYEEIAELQRKAQEYIDQIYSLKLFNKMTNELNDALGKTP